MIYQVKISTITIIINNNKNISYYTILFLLYNVLVNDSSSRNATEEQESLCRKIVKSKNYYEILQVQKTDSVEKIKKSYKKVFFTPTIHFQFLYIYSH